MADATGNRVLVHAHRQWTPLARALTAIGDHWTLLIVLTPADETLRLNALRTRLLRAALRRQAHDRQTYARGAAAGVSEIGVRDKCL